MIVNTKPLKAIVAVAAGLIVIFAVMQALPTKAKETQQQKTETQMAAPKTVTPPNLPAATDNSKYALPLTPAQVKALNAFNTANTQPEANKLELPPPAPAANSNAGRCVYNNQTYALGDIVKTDKGWIRCTPTLSFSPDKPNLPQPDRPAWTAIQ